MYRTDLAIERMEMAENEGAQACDNSGVTMEKTDYGSDVTATMISIIDESGEKLLRKPTGKYITIETKSVIEENEDVKDTVIDAVASELKKMISFHYNLKVLVAGLGNRSVTPDSLGPETASKVRVTRHLFIMFEADGDDEMSCVSCMIPGVSATTGMETADIIKKAVEVTCPEVLIVIDSLAARNIERVSTTIQITDTGISPGAGMGNHRTGINEGTIGIKVIAIGVPVVIDAATIIRDALNENVESANQIDEYINKFDEQLIVTSTDIDMIIKEFSDIIAAGINKTIHPGIYS
mgnify:CR=1 FL=1